MTSIEFRPAGAFASPLFSTQRSSRRAGASGAVASSVVLFVPERSYLFVGLTDGKILCWETDRPAARGRAPCQAESETPEGLSSPCFCPGAKRHTDTDIETHTQRQIFTSKL